jgi:benzodiazapine receptor
LRTLAWKLAVVVCFVAMVVANGLANALPLNGVTTGAVSDGYPIFFVPAGYVFSIWGLIYLGLLALTVTQLFSAVEAEVCALRPLFAFSSLVNGAWIFSWHYYELALSVVLMLTLLVTLIVLYRRVHSAPRPRGLVRWTVVIPLSLYAAWICVATIPNISALLWTLGWTGAPLLGSTWAAIMMVVAALILGALAITSADAIPPLVLAWALVGIVVKFPEQMLMRGVGLVMVAVMLLLAAFVAVRTRVQPN